MEFGADSAGTCSVWGLDPDNNNKVVFNGTLWTSQQDCFIEAVRIGQQGKLVSNENEQYLVPLAPVPGAVEPSTVVQIVEPPDGYAVVISGGSPPPP